MSAKDLVKNHTKNIVLVMAAGTGSRAQSSIPKQFVKVKQKAIIAYVIENLCQIDNIDYIACVIAPECTDLYAEAIKDLQKTPYCSKILPVITGGTTRQESVFLGLKALKSHHPDYVFIHDAARPNVSEAIINSLIHSLETSDAACPALPMADSLRKKDGTIIPRDDVYRVQTPQAFTYDKILAAHENVHHIKRHDFTDDIAIAQFNKFTTNFIEGSESLYKITYPADIERFKLERQPEKDDKKMDFPDIRMATGYDVHQLISGDGVILGGIKIPCLYALKGHSDADVLLHAITDSLLGSIAAQDIGYHFNPSDAQWKNADSAEFLRYAHDLIKQKNGIINFIDATIICEVPKITPHRQAIKENIANLLSLPFDRVSIKATTTEKLGFTGRKEGIAVQASSVIFLNK